MSGARFNQGSQAIANLLQGGDPRLHIHEFGLCRFLYPRDVLLCRELQQFADLLEGESQRLGSLDESQPRDLRLAVLAVARLKACLGFDEAGPFVVTDGIDTHACAFGGCPDPDECHDVLLAMDPILNRGPWSRVKIWQSEDDAQSRQNPPLARILAVGALQVRGLPQGARPRDSDIWRDLAPELVTKTQTYVDIREPGHQSPCRIILPVGIQFGFRLKDQPLGKQQVVVRSETQSGPAAFPKIEDSFDVEEVRSKSAQPGRRPVSLGPIAPVMPDTQLPAPPSTDNAVPDELGARVGDIAAGDIAFRLESQLVD